MINTKWIYSKIFSYSKKIKDELNISEEVFHNTIFEDSNNAFNFWIYSIVDDIYKAWMKFTKEQDIIEWDEIVSDKITEDDNSSWLNFKRYLYENISIEIDMWIRKLTEHLLNLILLRDIKNNQLNKTAKIYFLSLKLKDIFSDITNYQTYYSNKDFKFEHKSGLIEKNIVLEKLKKLLEWIEQPFYLKNLKNGTYKNASSIFESTSHLYKESIKICNNNEKLILWLTYDRYHNITQWIHWNWHYKKSDISLKFCISKYNELWLLLTNLISIIYEIKWIEKDDYLSNVDKLEVHLENHFKQKYNNWDLVLFLWKLHEIKSIKESSYWYFSCLIYRKSWDFKFEKQIPQIHLKLALNINNYELIIDQIKDHFPKDVYALYKEMDALEQFQALKNTVLDLNESWINIFQKQKKN